MENDRKTLSDELNLEERRKKSQKPEQPPLAKNVGDDTPNPLPDNGSGDTDGGGGGDPGRSA